MLIELSEPAIEPVSAQDVLTASHMDGDVDCFGIESLIAAARADAEHITGRRFIARPVRLFLDSFPTGPLLLGSRDVSEITAIKYYSGGIQITMSPSDYRLADVRTESAIESVTGSWPVADVWLNAIEITAVCGMATTAIAVPAEVRTWITMSATRMLCAATGVDAGKPQFVDRLLDRHFWRRAS